MKKTITTCDVCGITITEGAEIKGSVRLGSKGTNTLNKDLDLCTTCSKKVEDSLKKKP